MEIRLSVSQLKCACLDEEWLKAWLAGKNPPTQHFAPAGMHAVGGNRFHAIVEAFISWLVQDAKAAALDTAEILWAEMFRRFAEAHLDELAGEGRLDTALHLSSALQAFCRRIADLRRESSHTTGWSDLFLAQEHRVRDIAFTLEGRRVLITGVIDALRLHPQRGFELVDYKLSRGTNLRHDLVQLAIYARLLEKAEPGTDFCATLEYYLPELDTPLSISAKELNEIFDELVMPVLRKIAGAGQARVSKDLAASGAAPAGPQDDLIAQKITACFASFALPVTVAGYVEGPQLLRYTVLPATGVKVVSLANRAEDLQVALNLPEAPRIEPSASGVTVDIPKPKPTTVWWREVIERCPAGPVAFPVGVGVDNSLHIADLSEPATCHALVAGASGSGKSEWLKNVVASLLRRNRPEALRLALIDPKMLTFADLEGTPHLLRPLMTQLDEALDFLDKAIVEMERRYRILAQEHFSNLRERRSAGKTDLPFWVILFDEFADLILAGKEEKKHFETVVSRLAGKGRAAGIHLILATQRPDRNIVTGLIKANLPMKVCLKVTSAVNSQIVLEQPGAEKLLGRGDLLCDLGRGVHRAQSPLVTGEELNQLKHS